MRLNREQIKALSEYFSDFSKIIFASTVLGFFIPINGTAVSAPVFIAGTILALGSLFTSVRILR